jgi:hypothetical protein
MNLKFISKKYIGIFYILILIVLLRQNNISYFLFETYLGRFILICIILCISCHHHILGIIAVLSVIIIYERTYNYSGNFIDSYTPFLPQFATIEGMISNNKTDNNNNNNNSLSGNNNGLNSGTSLQEKINIHKQKIQHKINKGIRKIEDVNIGKLKLANNTNTTTTSTEGFDIIGTENTIKRGKQSNSIPVQPFLKNADNVAPYESSTFKENFSLF